MTNSLFKGYPFCEAKSLEIFPQESRPTGQQIDAAATDGIGVPADIIGLYSKALHDAEQQIKDMQTNYPFLPEDYGFEQLESTGFILKYKASGGNVGIERLNDSQYRLRATFREFINNDGIVIEEKSPIDVVITINNEREAFSAFQILGLTKYIKTQNETRAGDLVSTSELVLNHPEFKPEAEVEKNNESINKSTEEHIKNHEVTETKNENQQ